MPINPRPGYLFLHRRVINPDGTPMEYEVTRLSKGTVYYKPVWGGHSECCPIEYFFQRVAKV